LFSSILQNMIKVAIVEDNNTLRDSLCQLIDETDGMRCVAALQNLLNIISDLNHSKPDVILMDIGLPHISGIEGVRSVKENFNTIEVLMFTIFEDNDKIFEALKAGASGYLLKKSPPEEITEAIRSLYYGGSPMSPSIARRVIQTFQNPAPVAKDTYKLTTRENEILHSLVDGLSYKGLAEKYFISISTVRTHIRHIYEKLQVNTKSQAVAKVLKK
jgi:DNA-binding NarL/FixJ family response regulator